MKVRGDVAPGRTERVLDSATKVLMMCVYACAYGYPDFHRKIIIVFKYIVAVSRIDRFFVI